MDSKRSSSLLICEKSWWILVHLQTTVGIDDGARGVSASGVLLVDCRTQLAGIVGYDPSPAGNRLLLSWVISNQPGCFVD
jgi:hypothetical protein